MEIRFRFKTARTQRVYTVLKIVLKLAFIKMSKFKMKASKIFQAYWIKDIIKDKSPKL